MPEPILVHPDYYLGAVKLDGTWRFFYDILGMWMLNYKLHNAMYAPEPGGWRHGLLSVDRDNAKQYCEAMADHEIPIDRIPDTMSTLGGQLGLTFVVNFDEQVFINGWQDNIMIQEYAPEGWYAVEDDPYDYIPDELRALWTERPPRA